MSLWSRCLAVLLVASLGLAGVAPAAHAADDDLVICSLCDTPSPDDGVMERPVPERREPGAPLPPDEPLYAGDAGAAARAKNFLLGELAEGQLDPSLYSLPFRSESSTVDLPGLPAVEIPKSGGDLWGQTSEWFFQLYKYMVHFVLTFTLYAAFSFLLPALLLEPMLEVADNINREFIEPTRIVYVVYLLVIAFIFLAIVRQRWGVALFTGFMCVGVIALGEMLTVADMTRYAVSTAMGGATVLLLAAQGKDTSGVPAPSTAPVDTTVLTEALAGFISSLEETLIALPAQVLLFGGRLPDECAALYNEGRELGLAAGNPDFFRPMLTNVDCHPYAIAAMYPDAVRTVFAFVLFCYAIWFCYVFWKVAWPSIKGQGQMLGGVAMSGLLVLGAALPGRLRSGSVRYIAEIVQGLLAVLILALHLSIILVAMTMVFTLSMALPVVWRLVIALILPIAFFKTKGKVEASVRARVNAAASKMSNVRPTPKPDPSFLERNGNNLSLLASGAALGATKKVSKKAAGATVSGGGTAVKKTGHVGKVILFGDYKRDGIFLGKHGKPPADGGSKKGSGSSGSKGGSRASQAPKGQAGKRPRKVDTPAPKPTVRERVGERVGAGAEVVRNGYAGRVTGAMYRGVARKSAEKKAPVSPRPGSPSRAGAGKRDASRPVSKSGR